MIRQTKDGGFVYAESSESLNVGSFQTSAVKLDRNGKKEWSTVLGGGGPSSPYVEANSVEQTADGGFIVGGIKNNHFSLWKLNAAGQTVWNKLYSCEGGHVIQTPDGYAIDGSNAAGETVLVKTDANGEELWNKTVGKGQAISLMPAPDGGYLIGTSQNVIKTDSLALVKWSKPASGLVKAISTEESGALIVLAPATLTKVTEQLSLPSDSGHSVTAATYQNGQSEAIGSVTYVGKLPALKLDSEDYSIVVGQTLDTVLTMMKDGQSMNITGYGTYSVEDPLVASFSNDGFITGLKRGQTVITAAYGDMKATANLYVY
jgi:hypothetical protein